VSLIYLLFSFVGMSAIEFFGNRAKKQGSMFVQVLEQQQ
jgi:hypothetical protein